MGLFDLFEDVVDLVVETPGKIIETSIETVVRVPEVGINIVKGAIQGVEKGIEKIDDTLNKF